MPWSVRPGVEPEVREHFQRARYAVHREVAVHGHATLHAWSGVEEGAVAEASCITPASGHGTAEPFWGSAHGDVAAWARAVGEVLLAAVVDAAAAGAGKSSSEEPLPDAVTLPTALLTLTGEALAQNRSQAVADLARAHPLQQRALGGRWSTADPVRAQQVLHLLHDGALGHLRLVAVDRGHGRGSVTHGRQGAAARPPLMVGWVLHADGWRELVAGSPGHTRVVRRAPEVLADRLQAAFEVIR